MRIREREHATAIGPAFDWTGLARILAARADGLTTAEIAARFQCTATTIQKRLAELRAREESSALREPVDAAFLVLPNRPNAPGITTLMSKGLGRIGQAIGAAFEAEPERGVFVTWPL